MTREIIKCGLCGKSTWADAKDDTIQAKLELHNRLYAKGWRYTVYGGWQCMSEERKK